MIDDSMFPPDELVRDWADASPIQFSDETWAYELFIARQAAKWGADLELEDCCSYLRQFKPEGDVLSAYLLAARRPPGLKSRKERALDILAQIEDQCLSAELAAEIRDALEQLPDD